jgi:hypothetical protein
MGASLKLLADPPGDPIKIPGAISVKTVGL